MDEKKGGNFLKTAIAILTICLVGLGFYTFQFYRENKANQEILLSEKADLKEELQNLMAKYEQALKTNRSLSKDFSQAKKRVKVLLDSLEKVEANYIALRKYKLQILKLKKEKQQLFQAIDSLSKENILLQKQMDSTSRRLAKTLEANDSLVRETQKMDRPKKTTPLEVVRATAQAVELNRNSQPKAVRKSTRAEKIRVCFTLAGNAQIPKGKKQVYLQIINPDNNLLGKKGRITFGEAVLNYSKIIGFFYESKTMEICSMVAATKKELVPGRYIVNIFSGPDRLSSQRFELE